MCHDRTYLSQLILIIYDHCVAVSFLATHSLWLILTQISLKLLAIPVINNFSELPHFQWCFRFTKLIYLVFHSTRKYKCQPSMSKIINIRFVCVNNNVLQYFFCRFSSFCSFWFVFLMNSFVWPNCQQLKLVL